MNTLADVLRSNEIVLFIGGSLDRRDKPSGLKAFQALESYGCYFSMVDVSLDPRLQREVQDYSGHHLFPQLFVQGEFIGGYFIIPEFLRSGELERMLKREQRPDVPLLSQDKVDKQQLQANNSAIWSLRVSDEGSFAVTGAADRTVRIWDCDTLLPRLTLLGHRGWVNAIAISPDSKLIASGSSDATIRIWRAKDGGFLRTLRGHSRWINGLCFASDSRLLSVSADRTLRIWDVYEGIQIAEVYCHDACVWSVCLGPDGASAITAAADKSVRIWDLMTLRCTLCLCVHGATVSAVSSKGGESWLSASLDCTVIEWGRNGQLRTVYRDHMDKVWGVASSRSGDSFVSVSADGTAVVRAPSVSPQAYSFDNALTACGISRDLQTIIVGDCLGRLFKIVTPQPGKPRGSIQTQGTL